MSRLEEVENCIRWAGSTELDMARIARTLATEVDELQWRLGAVCKMLEVPTESSRKNGWLAYCEECWWRGEAEDAIWGTDPDSDGYCPECGKEILEMDGDWSREQSIHARAVAIAEGRDNG